MPEWSKGSGECALPRIGGSNPPVGKGEYGFIEVQIPMCERLASSVGRAQDF